MSDSDNEAHKAETHKARPPRTPARPAPTIDLGQRDFSRESVDPPESERTAGSATGAGGTAEEPPADAAPPRRAVPAFVPLLAAGLVGGVVGALVTVFIAAPGEDPVVQASVDSRLAALATRVDGLGASLTEATRRIDATPAGADPAALAALDQRIAALEGTPPPADLGPLEDRLAALENRATETSVREAVPSGELAALGGRIDALAARVDRLVSAPPKDPQTEAAARTIALTALVEAAGRGQPFQVELGQFRAIIGDDPALAALGPAAERGVPSKAYLAERFAPVAEAVRRAAARPDPEAGLLDRLGASARSLVSVRPVGAISGESTSAIVSRMEAAVAAGDLQTALAERETLGPAGQAASADWAAQANTRIALDRDVAALRQKFSGR
ncbi:COG4223 family protein [Prosthecomicrobium pneumaticum]|uniref:Inner membrane protein n=1 Tax=Prosthecomicrobium pneumaticum TaxID=81895 RepID=A0A7W9FN88_9HYPH|nr:mitofilin family membrane protein [Prosthecomicrobium pneumaticum]MBB5753765.1 hypothetical protein [Prosthecomicrobium pneumaticum]